MEPDRMSVRLHLRRIRVIAVLVDVIEKLVVEVTDARRVFRCPHCGIIAIPWARLLWTGWGDHGMPGVMRMVLAARLAMFRKPYAARLRTPILFMRPSMWPLVARSPLSWKAKILRLRN